MHKVIKYKKNRFFEKMKMLLEYVNVYLFWYRSEVNYNLHKEYT